MSGWRAHAAFVLGFLLAGVAPETALAHGDLHEQIVAATQSIDADPVNAGLRLHRGELHRLHAEWPAALADYDKAAELDPQLAVVELARCRLWFDSGDWEKARTGLDRFLTGNPANVEALTTRARVLVQLGDVAAAAADFARAIECTEAPEPDLYLERAAALMAHGAGHIDDALRSLDEGIARLGPLVTLELNAIELEVRQARYDAALARLDRVAAASPRKETWLTRRGEILERAGRSAEARAAFTAALAAIDSLPARSRETKTIADLTERVRAKLDR